MSDITVDRYALRDYGELHGAAGWVVIMALGPKDTYSFVCGRLFATEEEAVKYAKTLHESNRPMVKALRKA